MKPRLEPDPSPQRLARLRQADHRRLLAARLGARLLDNHMLLNPAEALFERSDPLHRSLRLAIRVTVFDYASRLAPGVPLIFTDALADHDLDRAFFDDCRRLAERRQARLVAVVVDCDEDENLRRLVVPGRAEQLKLTSPEVLARLRAKYQLLRLEGLELIELDVTGSSAEEAATAIAAS